MTEIPVKLNCYTIVSTFIIASFLFLTVADVHAKAKPRQVKGLGEQVQDVKSNVLSIAKELDQLEKQLLYPAHTQIAIFVSLRENAKLNLGSVDIEFDGKEVAHHLYAANEVEALHDGGVQRIYTGNVSLGKHDLKVTIRGTSTAGSKVHIVKSFPVEKGDKAGIAELLLSENTITLINR